MQLLANPWWVNLLIVVPLAMAFFWRKRQLDLRLSQLAWAAVFAGAFGFVEAAVVLYIRAASGLLPGYQASLAEAIRQSKGIYEKGITAGVESLPHAIVQVELWREAATIVMLVAVGFLAARALRDRLAIFLWCFAIWDAAYYAGLYATIRWPQSLLSPDILFLIPVPWLSQVWFPLLVDIAVVAAVILGRANRKSSTFQRAVAA